MLKKILNIFSKTKKIEKTKSIDRKERKATRRFPSNPSAVGVISEQKRLEIANFKKNVNEKLNSVFDFESSETSVKNLNIDRPKKKTNQKKSQSFSKDSKDKISTNKKVQQASCSVFNDKRTFDEFNLSPTLLNCLNQNGFKHPSKVQEKAIPTILEGKNLICSSETGSGKTLAFVIPILEKMYKKEIDQVVILTPTREIAIQIESVIKPLAETLKISTGLAIGGMDMLVQKNILREYPQILIATPGRLVDVFTQGLAWLDFTSLVVLDEVDRMLDMGFEKEISTLFKSFPDTIQTLMFTATMNQELERLSKNYVSEYELIKIGELMKTKESIEHLFFSILVKDKYKTLKSILKRKTDKKILIFFNSIDATINTFKELKKDRFYKIDCLHSRKSQEERNQVLNAFRKDRIQHLLTTDVLARGVDIPSIDAVINYELPHDSEDYIHRIGRTGRADFVGKALSFVDKKNEIKLKKIKHLIKSDRGFNFIDQNALNNF